MDEKLKSQLEQHRKKRVESKVETFEIRKAVMQREAKDILTLMFIVKNLRKGHDETNLSSIDLKDLADALERMRNSTISRWILMNMPNAEIAKEFELSSPRITQIKKEIIGNTKLF